LGQKKKKQNKKQPVVIHVIVANASDNTTDTANAKFIG